MSDSGCLNIEAISPELSIGAHNAVHTCLAVTGSDRAVLIADEATCEIASSLYAELLDAGAEVRCFVLEQLVSRPADVVPQPILKALEWGTVSLMIVQPRPGELHTRTKVMDLARARHLRHAHMPGVDERMMATGMRADYHRVALVQDRLCQRLRPESIVTVRTRAGTDLEVQFSPTHRWVRCDGLIKPGEPQNLPTGQLYTTPANVEGVFVGDGAIGEWFSLKYPELERYPLTVEISQGRIMDSRSANAALSRQFLLYVRSNTFGDRVGEFAFGTNLALERCLGNALQDENVPGAHLAFGGAAVLASTGARWTCRTHLPLIARECDIDIDGVSIMRAGVFADELVRVSIRS